MKLSTAFVLEGAVILTITSANWPIRDSGLPVIAAILLLFFDAMETRSKIV
jgi:hypothetical protein